MNPWLVLVTSLVSGACMAGVAWFMTSAKFRRPLFQGLIRRGISAGAAAWCAGLGFLAAAAAMGLMHLFSTGDSFMAKLAASNEGLAVICVVALALPFAEEAYYRGLIFPVLERWIGRWALLAVAVWFTIPHVFQLAGDWIGVPIIFAMGCLWTWQRHRTGSLLPGLITHLAYNFTLMAASVVARALGWEQ